MSLITIEGKSLGSKKRLFEDFSVPIPPSDAGDSGMTLRDLIDSTVRQQVAAFNQRQTDKSFIRVLTEKQIEEGVEGGKVDSGGSDIATKTVESEEAVATALQAFEDGMYLISIDGEEYRGLDETLFLNEQSRVTFIRLAFLAGG